MRIGLKTIYVIVLLLLFVFIAGYARSSAYADSSLLGIELKGGAYFQNFSGHLMVGSSVGNNLPTDISPADIGLETKKTEPALEVVLKILFDNRISLSYIPYEYNGYKILSKNIYFNGNKYDVNTPVTSRLDLDSYKLFFSHDFGLSNLAEVGLGVGVNVISAKTELDSPLISVSKKVNFPIPLLGVRVKVSPVDQFSVIGKFQGFTIGSNGYYYHANIGIDYKAIGPLNVFADYLYDKIHVNYNDVNGTLEYKGPEVGLKLSF